MSNPKSKPSAQRRLSSPEGSNYNPARSASTLRTVDIVKHISLSVLKFGEWDPARFDETFPAYWQTVNDTSRVLSIDSEG